MSYGTWYVQQKGGKHSLDSWQYYLCGFHSCPPPRGLHCVQFWKKKSWDPGLLHWRSNKIYMFMYDCYCGFGAIEEKYTNTGVCHIDIDEIDRHPVTYRYKYFKPNWILLDNIAPRTDHRGKSIFFLHFSLQEQFTSTFTISQICTLEQYVFFYINKKEKFLFRYFQLNLHFYKNLHATYSHINFYIVRQFY